VHTWEVLKRGVVEGCRTGVTKLYLLKCHIFMVEKLACMFYEVNFEFYGLI
jgi:hypothetical protein